MFQSTMFYFILFFILLNMSSYFSTSCLFTSSKLFPLLLFFPEQYRIKSLFSFTSLLYLILVQVMHFHFSLFTFTLLPYPHNLTSIISCSPTVYSHQPMTFQHILFHLNLTCYCPRCCFSRHRLSPWTSPRSHPPSLIQTVCLTYPPKHNVNQSYSIHAFCLLLLFYPGL